MNKSKVLTSLALAGVLTAGVLGANVNAASGKLVGAYANRLDNSRIAAAYNVSGADGKITTDDLTADFGTVSGVTGDVTTGANFTAGGKDYTLVVYGDVNGNNKINTGDVIAIQQMVAGSKEGTALEKIAADLSGNDKVDTGDALRVQRYVAGIVTTPEVKALPEVEPEPDPVADVSNIEVKSDEEIVVKFDLNASDFTYTLEGLKDDDNAEVTASVFDKEENEATLTINPGMIAGNQYKLTVKDADGNTIKETTFTYKVLAAIESAVVSGNGRNENGILDDNWHLSHIINSDDVDNLSVKVTTVAANETADATVTVTLKDSGEKEAVGTAKLSATSTIATISNFTGVSDLEDGEITVEVEIKDNNGNTVEETYALVEPQEGDPAWVGFIKTTIAPEIVDVATLRAGTSVEATPVLKGNYEIPVAYYYSLTNTTADAIIAEDVVNEEIADLTLSDDAEYTLNVVAVDLAHNISNVFSAKVAKPNIEALEAMDDEDVTIKAGTEATFVWDDEDYNTTDKNKIKGYKVVLFAATAADNFNNAVVVKSTEIGKGYASQGYNALADIREFYNDEDVDNTAYKFFAVKVQILSNTSELGDSAFASSVDKYEIKSLAAPEVNEDSYSFEDGVGTLTWATVPNNPASYEVNVYKVTNITADHEDVVATTPINSKPVTVAAGNREVNVNDLLSNLPAGKYVITAKSIAASDSIYVDSDEAELLTTYKVIAPSDLTLELVDGNNIKGTFTTVSGQLKNEAEEYEYNLIYTCADRNGTDKTPNANVIENDDLVAVVNTEKLYGTIEEVEPLYTYSVKAQVVYDGNVIAESSAQKIATPETMINLSGERTLTISAFDGVNANGNVAVNDYDEIKLKLNNEVYTLKSDDDNAVYSKLLPLLNDVLSVGDKITLKDGAITAVEINSAKGTYNFGSSISDLKVTLNADTIASVKGTFKEVKVTDSAAILDLSFATITDRVVVEKAQPIIVKTAANKDTAIKVTSAAATITVNDLQIAKQATNTALELTANTNSVVVTGTKAIDNTLGFKLLTTAKADFDVEVRGARTGLVTVTNNADAKYTVNLTANSLKDLTVVGTDTTRKVDITNAVYNGVLSLANVTVVTTGELVRVPLTETFVDEATITPVSGEVTISADGTVKGAAVIEAVLESEILEETEDDIILTTEEDKNVARIALVKTEDDNPETEDVDETEYAYLTINVNKGSATCKVVKNADDEFVLNVTTTADSSISFDEIGLN